MPNPVTSIYRSFCKLWLRVLRGVVSRLQKMGLSLRGAKFAGKVRLPFWLEPPVHAECLSFGDGAALDERVTLLAAEQVIFCKRGECQAEGGMDGCILR